MSEKIEVQDTEFFNIAAFRPEYSFKIRVDGGDWMNVAVNGNPLTFASREARDHEMCKFLKEAARSESEDTQRGNEPHQTQERDDE